MGVFDGRQRERTADAVVALIAFALTVVLLAVPEDEGRSFDATALVLAAAASLPLVARRRFPLAVFVAVTAASAGLVLLDYPTGPPIGPTVGVYNLALLRTELFGSTRLTLALTGVMYLLHVAAFTAVHGLSGAQFVLGIPLWGAAWFAGDRTRLRRERIAELEERAVRAEREAQQERKLAAAEERTRIARDLHDSAGHAINVILVEAGAARLLQEQDPVRARTALETIEEVARETMGEIDQLVRVLREDGSSEVEPPPGLAALDRLVRRHLGSGLEVSVSVDGERRPLPPPVDRAAYRILQEALTNAARHSDGPAAVELAYGADALALSVANPSSGPEAGEGHGIVGMRERTALLGGSLEAGRDDGVFRVLARLPYEARP